MSRTIKILVVVLTVFTFFVQNSYAFWGRKKTTKTPESKIQKTEPEVKKESSVQGIKKEESAQKQKEEVKKTPVAEKKVDKKIQKKKKKLKLERDKKRKQINNTQWNISLSLMGAKSKPKQDVLIFEENRFYAEKTSREGFNATNYTISIQDDGVTVWETMQTAEEGRINFWRGEIPEDMKTMRGIVSKQLPDGTRENYSFISQSKNIINK